MSGGGKSDGAFRTIGELAAELALPQHILRYWETRFPQLRPLQRAGNRRYYRPDDVALAHRINRLLNEEGYTVRGVQKLLEGGAAHASSGSAVRPADAVPTQTSVASPFPDRAALIAIRTRLAEALQTDDIAART